MRKRSSFYGICFWLVVGLLLLLPGRLAAQPRSLWVDLLVYGATPQGVTAAVAAASRGLRVLLAEPSEEVGGVFSRSWLNTLDLSRDRWGRPLYGGLTLQFIRRLGSWDGVEVRRAEQVLRGMLSEASVVPRLGWRLMEVERAHRRLETALFATPDGAVEVRAGVFLDATDLATLAAAAGARFTVGREDTGLDRRQMAAGLIFRLAGLSWERVGAAVCPRRPCPTGNGRVGRLVWGLNDLTARYVPSDPDRFALRGLELALQDDGTVLVKGLQVFGVDATDPESLRQASLQAQAEAGRVVRFLRRAAPDLFGTAELVGVAPSLYIRESRHLVGRYRLRADDVLYGRDFPDALSLGGYPMDGQSYVAGEPPYLPGVPAPYGVP
ncbi:MAG: FAD-dependent oxidoreductase, partial [Armatimonadota bacterium]|nr:FAD-dependent oxidoreductase [Armatimonadota bacterium]